MRRLKVLVALLGAAMLQPALAAAPALAQAEDPAVSPHAALLDAMQSGIDQEASLDTMLAQVAAAMVNGNPELAALEEEHPGMIGAMVLNLRPVLRSNSDRVTAVFRPRLVAEIAAVMSEEESTALAGFYNSDLGRRVTRVASQNMSVANASEAAIAGETVSAEDVGADLARTTAQTMEALSLADRTELMAQSLATPGFLKMPQLMQQVAAIRAEMESAPPTADEQQAIVAAVQQTVAQFAGEPAASDQPAS